MSNQADLEKPAFWLTIVLTASSIVPILCVMIMLKFEVWNLYPVQVLHAWLMSTVAKSWSSVPLRMSKATAVCLFVTMFVFPAAVGLAIAWFLLKGKKKLGIIAPAIWMTSMSLLLLMMASLVGR